MRKISINVTQFKLRPHKRFESFKESVLNVVEKSKKSDILVFGEWFTLGLLAVDHDLKKIKYSDIKGLSKFTEDYLDLFSRTARRTNQVIVGGTTVEEDNGKYYDTCYVFSPDGSNYKHRKTHLFPLEREEWGMSEYQDIQIIKTEKARIGICVCYESQIPECSRALTLRGAEIIVCPSFTLTEAGYYRIRNSCQARSIENQLVTVMSSTVGKLTPKLKGIGRSAVLSPCDKPWPHDGIVADGTMNRETVISSIIDIDDIYVTREKGAARPHKDRIRRSDMYSKWLSGTVSSR